MLLQSLKLSTRGDRLNLGRVVWALGLALAVIWLVFLVIPLPVDYNQYGVLRSLILIRLAILIALVGAMAIALSRFGYQMIGYGIGLLLTLPLSVLLYSTDKLSLELLIVGVFMVSTLPTAFCARKRL